MTTPSELVPIKEINDIWDKPGVATMCSVFDDTPNITKEILIHLLEGRPVVDLSDGEYIHFFQLDDKALQFINEKNVS